MSEPTLNEQIEVLAYAVERITVELQELAVRCQSVIGGGSVTATLAAMGEVNRRLIEIFPEPDPPARYR